VAGVKENIQAADQLRFPAPAATSQVHHIFRQRRPIEEGPVGRASDSLDRGITSYPFGRIFQKP
jgi:hypothetical protein